MRKRAIGLIGLIGLITTFSPAMAADIDEVLAKIHKNYSGMRDMKARFSQEAYNRISKMTLKETGTVFVKRPGLMRWDYQSPQIKQLVINGHTTWFYIPEDRQVVKGEIGDTAFAFLTHNRNLTEDFNAALGPDEGGSAVVELTPLKKMGNIARVRLVVTPSTGNVEKVITVDGFNNTTTITLSDMQMNANLSAGLFDFNVPKGIRVMDTGKTD
ncbi:MAG: outer membrane lipoprotein chaperone LolA [Nitrospirota bacterium]|nr:outer membrane lipoprotein chaperone LolA [Nitrospirota bacterium]